MNAPFPEEDDCPEAVASTDPRRPGRLFTILNRKGLHARATAKFVQIVERFDAAVEVTRCGETVGGRSIMGLLTLAAAQGTSIAVTAQGPEAEAVLDALQGLIESRFGEAE